MRAHALTHGITIVTTMEGNWPYYSAERQHNWEDSRHRYRFENAMRELLSQNGEIMKTIKDVQGGISV